MSAERIGAMPFAPSLLRLDHRCLMVLRSGLAAVRPEEGCALVIGTMPTAAGDLRITAIWPCCNAWRPSDATDSDLADRSRRNCFVVDPREQIAAQRWARQRQCQLLGVAHSHPQSPASPSIRDCHWGQPERLMIILGSDGTLRAWWMARDRSLNEITILIWDTQQHG